MTDMARDARPRGSAAAEEAPAPTTRETLSQLVARILDQLSISAWLPAGAAVFITVLLVELDDESGDLPKAMEEIRNGLGWGDLGLVIAAVILMTMLTQAFQFGAIRLLEGYWGAWRFAGGLANLGCRWQLRRMRRLYERKEASEGEAQGIAYHRMEQQYGIDVVALVKKIDLEEPLEGADDDHLRTAESVVAMGGWRQWADAPKLHRLDTLKYTLLEYPAEEKRPPRSKLHWPRLRALAIRWHRRTSREKERRS
jgi:hypothetical protein